MEGLVKVFLKVKFINFESFKNGIFLVEMTLNDSTSGSPFTVNEFNICTSNRESFYDSVMLDVNPIEFYKEIFDRKKDENPEGGSQIAVSIKSYLIENINEILNIDERGNIVISPDSEKALKDYINKQISLRSFNNDIFKLGFFYEIDTYSEEEVFKLKKEVFSDDGAGGDSIFVSENAYVDCSFILSPLKGISIFLLEAGDIIYVKKNEINSKDDEEIQQHQVVVKSIDFVDGFTEVTVEFDDGREGLIKEAEMVKIKGIKPGELKKDSSNYGEGNGETKKSSLFNEFKKNLVVLILVIVFITFMIILLDNF